MITGIRHDGITSSKFVTNVFIFLFIVRGAASLIESGVPRRARNTTCSLRLTRQKVLIQQVEDPENYGTKQRTGRKYGSDNENGYVSPDIVVEEFRIRAKIHFQARPKTCRDTLTAISNDTKSGIGSSSSRDQRIVYCHAESLIPKNDTQVEVEGLITRSNNESINIDKKNVLSQPTIHLLNKIVLNSTEMVKLKNGKSPMAPNCKENCDIYDRGIEKTTKKVNNDFSSRNKKKRYQFANDKKEFLKKIAFSDGEMFGIKSEEPKKRKLLWGFYDWEDKSQKTFREIESSKFHSRSRKSTRMMNDRVIDSSIKKTTRYLDKIKKEFVGENRNHFLKNFEGFLNSHKVENKAAKHSKRKDNLGTQQIKSINNKTEMENGNILPFFHDIEIVEIKNNKLEKPRPLSVTYKIKKKLHIDLEGNRKSDISQACHTNSTKNYAIPLRVKKRETKIDVLNRTNFSDDERGKINFKNYAFDNSTSLSHSYNVNDTFYKVSNANDKSVFQLQNKKSLKNVKNNTEVTIKNIENKSAKQSTNKNKNKKSRSDTSSKTLQSKTSKASLNKTLNSTQTNIRMETPSNTIWNFTMPPVIVKYFTFISSLLGIDPTGNKNHSPSAREEINKTISSNITDGNFVANTSTANALPGITEDTSQNLSKFFRPNSTEIDHTIFKEYTVQNSTQDLDYISNKTRLPVSLKNSRKTSMENDIRVPIQIASKILTKTLASGTFETPPKNHSENTVTANNYTNISISEKLAKSKDKYLNATDAFKSTIQIISKDFTNFSTGTIDRNNEQLSTTIGQNASAILNFRSDENEAKLSKLPEPIKFTQSYNLTKTSRETTSEKPEEFPEKTTLNFTIIDPNCTEPFVRNSLNNNSMDQSSGIVEVIAQVSTYPTIRRYSRNDSAIENASLTKNYVPYVQNNNVKNRQTKNSLNGYNLPNSMRRGRGGAITRGRMRSRYKGKDQYPSLPRIVKNSWRKNNGSAILNFSTTPNSFMRPLNFDATLIPRKKGKSTENPFLRGQPDLSTVFSRNTDDSKMNTTLIEGTTFNSKSSLSITTEVMISDIPQARASIPPVDGDFSKVENKTGEYLKEEWEPLTSSSRTTTGIWGIKVIRKNVTFDTAESKEENDVIDEIPTTKNVSTKSTLLSYDQSISGHPSISMNIRKTNQSSVSNNSIDVDVERTEEIMSNKFDLLDSKNSVINASFARKLILEIAPPTKLPALTSESQREQLLTIGIINITVKNESSTVSYDESSLTHSTIFNEFLWPTQKKMMTNESLSITENEILPEVWNTSTTADETVNHDTGRRVSLPYSMENETIVDYTADGRQRYSLDTKKLMAFKYSMTPAYTDEDSINSQNATKIYLPTQIYKVNKSMQSWHEHFSPKQELSISTENIISLNNSIMPTYTVLKNHETIPIPESLANSSGYLENMLEVHSTSITGYSDFNKENFSPNEESVLTPVTESASSVFSSNVIRRARASGAISDYSNQQEPELDYDIDSLAENEASTEKTLKTTEDNAEVPKAQDRIFQELRTILSGYGALFN